VAEEGEMPISGKWLVDLVFFFRFKRPECGWTWVG